MKIKFLITVLVIATIFSSYAYEKTYDISHVFYYTLTSVKLEEFVRNAEIISPLNANNKTITKDTILVGTPNDNPIIKKYMGFFDVKVNETYPGKDKGVIEKQIINGHTVVILTGSDIQGVYSSILTFANLNDLPDKPIMCETFNKAEVYGIPSLDSKYFRSFVEDHLLTLKNIEEVRNISYQLKGDNKKETAENIAKWVAEHVKYDYGKAKKIENGKFEWKDIYNSPLKTVKTGRGICLDYATLTSALLLNDNITPYILDVYLYNESSMQLSKISHASVAVEINNTFFVIDQQPKLIPINEYTTQTFEGNLKIASIVIFKVVKEGDKIEIIKYREIPGVAIYGDLVELLNMRFNN
ncbi:MAG: hypothetical protein GXN95_00555 [Methanococci archaeon]|nr:hypothetical protein [Methanococci archaeon]